MSKSSRGAWKHDPARRPVPARFVPLPSGGPKRPPAPWLPLIVIVIVVVTAAVSPAGQVVAVLSALATVLALLGFREATS